MNTAHEASFRQSLLASLPPPERLPNNPNNESTLP
jgi:hypothetical protein